MSVVRVVMFVQCIAMVGLTVHSKYLFQSPNAPHLPKGQLFVFGLDIHVIQSIGKYLLKIFQSGGPFDCLQVKKAKNSIIS
jgi:hypothetical protein